MRTTDLDSVTSGAHGGPPLQIILLVLSLGCLFACQQKVSQNNANVAATPSTATSPATLKLNSTAFVEGGAIPAQYTCDGTNISPPLAWSNLPPNTKAVALTVDDPDAPLKTWVHWVVYDLPATTTQLAENVKNTLPGGGKQGTNDFRKASYGGPCPPSGTHRYFFKLYALDAETSLQPGATKDDLLKAMEGHILARGELMGKYTHQ
jgi:Raf kinase inhibitor-like YbhB/YbcL family protein